MRKFDINEVEKILGFKLTDEQKCIIFCKDFDSWDNGKRKTGLTTAAALRLLFSDGDTLHSCFFDDFAELNKYAAVSGDNVGNCYRGRFRFFMDMVIDLGRKLSSAGIDVREIYHNDDCTIVKKLELCSEILETEDISVRDTILQQYHMLKNYQEKLIENQTNLSHVLAISERLVDLAGQLEDWRFR